MSTSLLLMTSLNEVNDFLVITKTTEHRDVEANHHDASSFLFSERKAQAVHEFVKQMKVSSAEAWGDTTNIHSE